MEGSHQRASRLVVCCSSFSILVGALALVGWLFDIVALRSMVAGSVAMNPMTAVAFLLGGLALWSRRNPDNSSVRRYFGICCALLVTLIGALKLNGYVFGWDPGLDRVLFRDSLGTNCMAPNTAFCFLLIGLALATLDLRSTRRLWPAQCLTITVAIIALISLVGYGYGAASLYHVAAYIPMALNTAATFQVLSAGVLLSRPSQGVVSILFAEGPGGLMARRLLPAAVAIPCVLGWLRVTGQHAGLYDTEFGAALMVATTVVLLLIVIGWIAAALNRADVERSQAEEVVRQLNVHLEQRVAQRTSELAHTNSDLQQKNQENEMFVYSVSHDLRSPLVNLQGFSKELSNVCGDVRAILATNELPEGVRERGLKLIDTDMHRSITFIQTAVSRLSNIIDALLRLSRAGRVEYQLQKVDVSEIAGRVVASMSGTAFERGASIQIHELPAALGDPTAIEQVVANLVGNALKYVDPKRPPIIEIGSISGGSTSAAESTADQTYFVKDNGLGLPESSRTKLFQAFKRFHPDVAPGEGMGLAIVRRIVERHGGKLWVDSTPGVGSTFFWTLAAEAAVRRSSKSTSLGNERKQTDASRTTDHCFSGR